MQQPTAKANYEAEEEAHMYSSQVLWPSWSISIWVLMFFLDKFCKPHESAISACLPEQDMKDHVSASAAEH